MDSNNINSQSFDLADKLILFLKNSEKYKKSMDLDPQKFKKIQSVKMLNIPNSNEVFKRLKVGYRNIVANGEKG